MKNEKLTNNLLKADGITPDRPSLQETQAFDKLLDQHLSNQQDASAVRLSIWRKIMHSNITKLTAAAIILLAFVIAVNMPNSTLYALTDTIDAYNTIHSLKITAKIAVPQGLKNKHIWVQSDQQGNATRIRMEIDNAGPPIGPVVIVANQDTADSWLPDHKLHLVNCQYPEILLRGYRIEDMDIQKLIRKLHEQEKKGELTISVDQPEDIATPIVVTIMYPQGSVSQDWKKIIYVDQQSKLVQKIEVYKKKDSEFKFVSSSEYSDYNKMFDEALFSLDNDVSSDAIVFDSSKGEPGVLQGDMTSKEVAEETARQFFQAAVDKDFDRAGEIAFSSPASLVKMGFMGVDVLKVLSVGPAVPDSEPGSESMNCPCRILIDAFGEKLVINATRVIVTRATDDTKCWIINSLAYHIVSATPEDLESLNETK